MIGEYDIACDAIQEVATDTTVSIEKNIENLQTLINIINDHIYVLNQDLDNDVELETSQ